MSGLFDGLYDRGVSVSPLMSFCVFSKSCRSYERLGLMSSGPTTSTSNVYLYSNTHAFGRWWLERTCAQCATFEFDHLCLWSTHYSPNHTWHRYTPSPLSPGRLTNRFHARSLQFTRIHPHSPLFHCQCTSHLLLCSLFLIADSPALTPTPL